uniref:BMP and activin membrane-bound inhibitor homolog n=1 Tax=Plectus sambesii TaxID=2011161 RepID=A0A914XLA3_9BILA
MDARMMLSSLYALLLAISSAYGIELRCYCNLPACVNNAYMCKSNIGCFQELADQSQSDSRIGCLELLPSTESYVCLRLSPFVDQSRSQAVKKQINKRSLTDGAKKSEKTLVRCCREDMCNYVAQLQPELSISVRDPSPAEANDRTSVSRYSSWSDSQWFRLVVIAVPIAGGVILLVLIVFACALLKASEPKTADHHLLVDIEHSLSLPHRTRPKETALIFTERHAVPSVTVAFRD